LGRFSVVRDKLSKSNQEFLKMATVYLFLHGLFVTLERQHDIEIVLPRVPGHVYRAGSWLQETDLARGGRFVLRGITAGTGSIRQADKMIHLPGLLLTRHSRAATIRVPRPNRILPFCIARKPPLSAFLPNSRPKLPSGQVVQRLDTLTGWPEIASVHVLEYQGVDANRVHLERHYWEPYVVDDAISLHVIATSLTPEGKAHLQDTDGVLRKVVSGYPGLKFEDFSFHDDWRTTPVSPLVLHAAPPEDAVTTPQGRFALSRAELEDIPSRTVRIGRLGRIKQDGRSPGSLWHETQPLYTEESNCGPIDITP
jgi:hypothetical protein